MPDRYIRRDARGHYKGQKQIWYLLQLVGHDWDLNLRATNHPEFDAWRWNDYWVPLDVVVEFKRGVCEMALTELARYLPRRTSVTGICAAECVLAMGNTHMATHMQRPRCAPDPCCSTRDGTPPGASFDPDPQNSLAMEAVHPAIQARSRKHLAKQTHRNAIMNKPMPEQTPASAFSWE